MKHHRRVSIDHLVCLNDKGCHENESGDLQPLTTHFHSHIAVFYLSICGHTLIINPLHNSVVDYISEHHSRHINKIHMKHNVFFEILETNWHLENITRDQADPDLAT